MAPTTWVSIGLTLLFGVAAVWLTRRKEISSRRVWSYVWIAAGLITIIYVINSLWRYRVFEAHAFDLGIFDQAVWHLSHFQAPASTVRDIGNLFGDHFHPIISLFVPFYWFFHSPLVLLVGQAILFGLVGPVVFALALRLRLPPLPAAVMAVVITASPGFWLATNFDFHEVAFGPVLFFLAALTFETRRWRWYWLSVIGLLLTKESLALYVALLGLTFVVRRFRAGWKDVALQQAGATIVIGVAAFFLITRVIIPHLSQGQGYIYWHQYASVGATPLQAVKNVVVHPGQTFGLLLDRPEKRDTIKKMLATDGFLPLLSWTTWPLLILSLGERFWTSSYGIWLLQFHYQLNMVAVFGLGTLYLASDLERWKKLRGISSALAIMMVVGTVWTYDKLEPGKIFSDPSIASRPTRLWSDDLHVIPATAAVAAQDAFVPHLAHRQTILLFPNIKDAQWIVLDPVAPSWPLTSDQVKEWQTRLRQDPQWALVHSSGTLTIFHRQSADKKKG